MLIKLNILISLILGLLIIIAVLVTLTHPPVKDNQENWVYGENQAEDNATQMEQTDLEIKPTPETPIVPLEVKPTLPLPTDEPKNEPIAPPVEPPGNNLVLAHYMPWYKTRAYSEKWQHWEQSGHHRPGSEKNDAPN